MIYSPLITADTLNAERLVVNDMGTRWNNLGTFDAITITGGSIEGTTIGVVTPQAGHFTTLSATGTLTASTVTLANAPTAADHATRKDYVDTLVGSVTLPTWSTLSGKPSWTSTFNGAYSSLTGQPSLFSGAYNDLTGKPTLGSLSALSTILTTNVTDAQITYAKIQNVSNTDKILGRLSPGPGPAEEIPCTSVARTLLAQTTQALMRSTGLGLGTASTLATGTTNGTIPVLIATGLPAVSGENLTSIPGTKIFQVRDERVSGTNGGTFNSGSWITRTLNTTKTNTITGASLATNQITLTAGTYDVDIIAHAFECGGHQAKLANITDVTDSIVGLSVSSGTSTAAGAAPAVVRGRITIAATKVFEVRHRCSTTKTTSGLGLENGFGTVEVYVDVMIRKIA